ncbi:MAG: hypothetical protein R6V27_05940 [Balneolaceae bacterium]
MKRIRLLLFIPGLIVAAVLALHGCKDNGGGGVGVDPDPDPDPDPAMSLSVDAPSSVTDGESYSIGYPVMILMVFHE